MAVAMSIIRSARPLSQVLNHSRNLFNVQPSFPIQRLQLAVHSSKWYASSAVKDNTLQRQLNRLNNIARNGKEVKWQEIENIKEMLSQKAVPTTSQAIEIIRYCGNAMTNVEPAKRQRLLNELVTILDNVPKSILFYNEVLKKYEENEHSFSASDFLADLEKKGITPNSDTYQHLISMHSRRGNMVGVTNILQLMQSKQMPITTGIYNDLILGHVNAGDMASANEAIGTMKVKGLKLDSQTFANLVKGYAKVGDVAGIEQIFERFKEEELDLLNEDVMNAICELAENGHSNPAESLIKYLRSSLDFNPSIQDAIDRLIRAKHEELIPKTLATTDVDSCKKLAKHCLFRMVQNKCSAERVNSIWKAFESLGWNLSTHMGIFEVGLHSESPELIQAILKEMKARPISIPEKDFRTLLRLEGQKGIENLVRLLEIMKTEYGVNISSETLRDHVLPHLDCANNPLLAITRIHAAGLPHTHVIQCVVSRCLRDNNIKTAHQIVSKYSTYHWQWERLGKDLVAALQKTNDVQNFVHFLHIMYESVRLEKKVKKKANESGSEFIGMCLYKTVTQLKEDRERITNEISNDLISHGLSISYQYGAQIQKAFGDDLTPNVSKSIQRLCSNKLKPRPLEKNSMESELRFFTSKELLSLISDNQSKGKSVEGLQKSLLHAHIRENNIPEAEELIELFESKGLLTDYNYVTIISMYARARNHDKALSTFERRRQKNPGFVLYSPTNIAEVLKALLVNGAELSKIQGFLEANRKNEPPNGNEIYNFDDILNILAEGGDAVLVNGVYKSLLQNNHICRTKRNAAALVKVHLVKNNLSEAIAVFEKTINEIGKDAARLQLYLKLIEANDSDKIQHIVDTDTKIYGKISALYNLACAYAVKGMTQETRNLLENEILSKNSKLLRQICEHAFKHNDVKQLKTLLEATRGLSHDRQPIFFYLLLSYRRDNKVEEALDLWNQQKEEDLIPEAEFERVLDEFLRANDVEPPFKFDATQMHVSQPKSNATQQITEETGIPPLEKYIEWKHTKSSNGWEWKKLSSLFFMLLEKKHVDEANEVAVDMFAQNTRQFGTIFEDHLKKLSADRNYEVLDKISKLFTIPIKSYTQFEKYYVRSYANGTAGEEYLQKMNSRIVNAESEKELEHLRQSFPKVGLLDLLKKQPQMLDECTRLAEQWFEKKIYGPMNVLWLYHCIAANDLSAGEKIWRKYFANAASDENVFMIEFAKKSFNIEKMEKLQKQLEELIENKKADGTV